MKDPKSERAWQVWLLVAVTLGCLAPFLSKAVHMDDPLFVWTARHIQKTPLNFYGFNVNWYGLLMPVSNVMQNPPLAAYYMAAVGSLMGWSEFALHFGFLWPAVAAILGIYFLAREFCGHPLLAALAALATPAFLVSATSLMCDILMLAFWVWAIFFWIRGVARQSHGELAVSALLIVACALTKYFGLSLIPLLAVYALLTTRKWGWLAHLVAALLILAGYQIWTRHLYGANLLYNALDYATHSRVGGAITTKIATGFCFIGGCVFIVPAALPFLWGKRGCIVAAAAFLVLILILSARKSISDFSLVAKDARNWLFIAQWAAFVIGGMAVLGLAALDAIRHRDAKSVLLLLSVFGTFTFAVACNWTVAARNILPMVPSVAILLVRRMETAAGAVSRPPRLFWVSLAVSLALSLSVAQADFNCAQSARYMAQVLVENLTWKFKTLAFEGHWGFQYYMEQYGAIPLDRREKRFLPNEAIIIPLNNSSIRLPDTNQTVLVEQFNLPSTLCLATMNYDSGAGFYSDGWGPAPFVFCRPPVDSYVLYRSK